MRNTAVEGLAFSILFLLTMGSSAESTSNGPFQCRQNCLKVDHSKWDDVLKACVVPDQSSNGIKYSGMDYQKLRDTKKGTLKSYLNTLASTDVDRLSHQEGLAFMINAYNAFTVDIVVEHNPRRSIRDLSSFWKGSVFKRYKHKLKFGSSQKDVSLDDVEKKYILDTITRHNDPRVHSAVNCASVSCPDLRGEAYTADMLESQLDDQMRIWMANTGKGLKVESSRVVYLSKIFDWYSGDFKAGKLAIAASYAPEDKVPILQKSPHIRYFGYDWDLNKPRSSRSQAT